MSSITQPSRPTTARCFARFGLFSPPRHWCAKAELFHLYFVSAARRHIRRERRAEAASGGALTRQRKEVPAETLFLAGLAIQLPPMLRARFNCLSTFASDLASSAPIVPPPSTEALATIAIR